MKYSCPIVDVHASWLALNPIHGCPFGCKYCFMSGIGNTRIKPLLLCTPAEAAKKLIENKNYNGQMPICLFSSTDAFSLPSNVEYAKELLVELFKLGVKNPIIFITKCYIPVDFLDLIDELENKGMKFVFFLSYSGLDSIIERGINHNKIRENFINLKNRNKMIIHYWRPFIPQNSSDEKIEEVLNFVKKYAVASVVIGLKVQESYVNNLDFWDEVIKRKDEAINSESVWTKNAYDRLYKNISLDYKIFRSTSCALSYCLKIPDYNFYIDTDICKLNNCPQEQIEICRKRNIANIEIAKNIIDKYFSNKEVKYNIDENNRIIIFEDTLSTSEVVSLKYLTGYNIISNRKTNDHYWNTGHYEDKNLII